MNLLEDIQKDAIDAVSDLGSLLRKCKVLAARLGSKELEDWLTWESNGYPKDVLVPGYRIWSLELKGHFSGVLGQSLRNAPIPLASLPEQVQKSYEEYECRLSISTLEVTLENAEKGLIKVATGDLLAATLGTRVYENMNCLQCWAEFSRTRLDELLNTVRERVLDFSLAVWKEHPNAGETDSNTQGPLSPDKVMHIFNTTVYNGSANVVGTANDSSISFNIKSNDLNALHRVLKNYGISEEDIEELKDALAADKPPQSRNQFGPKVSSWIAGMIQKASEGTWGITIGAAANLLGEALSKFYGL